MLIKNKSMLLLPPRATNNESTNICQQYINAINFLDLTSDTNMLSTLFIVIIGLIGNILPMIVFLQKKFRKRSSEVFLLMLAISNGLFLLFHFFEDTLRKYINYNIRRYEATIPLYEECISVNKLNMESYFNSKNSLLFMINIIDKYELCCKIMSFFRYFLPFISAYLILIFTMLRTIGLYSPKYKDRFLSPILAWKIVIALIPIAAVLCSLFPFLFKLNKDIRNGITVARCETDKNQEKIYFITTAIYAFLIMLAPIVTIITCNSLIIFQICRALERRKVLFARDISRKRKNKRYSIHDVRSFNEDSNFYQDRIFSVYSTNNNNNAFSMTSNYLTVSSKFNPCVTDHSSFVKNLTISQRRKFSKFVKFKNNSQKVTRSLVIISLSYTFLNLPYFVTRYMFYYTDASKADTTYLYLKYLSGFINLAEIFYVLNFATQFFFFCSSHKRFFQQLKASLFKSK